MFGCAEELSDDEINHIIATNLTGSIQLIKTSLPYLRKQGGGRIIQLSSYGGQVAYPANSMYHATKFGIEGFCEAVAQEVEQFNIGVTIVEPGGARTEFRYGSAKVANMEKAPLRMVLGSQALSATIERLKERIAYYETQTELAASTDIKGE